MRTLHPGKKTHLHILVSEREICLVQPWRYSGYLLMKFKIMSFIWVRTSTIIELTRMEIPIAGPQPVIWNKSTSISKGLSANSVPQYTCYPVRPSLSGWLALIGYYGHIVRQRRHHCREKILHTSGVSIRQVRLDRQKYRTFSIVQQVIAFFIFSYWIKIN